MSKKIIALVWDYVYECIKWNSKLVEKKSVNQKDETFLQWNAKLPFQKVLGLLNFGTCPNFMPSVNVAVEIQLKHLNERALNTGEQFTFEYVNFFLSFHTGTLSIPWAIAPFYVGLI